MDDDVRAALIQAIHGACWEVIPLQGIERKLAHLPPKATVAITCSPEGGIVRKKEEVVVMQMRGVYLL